MKRRVDGEELSGTPRKFSLKQKNGGCLLLTLYPFYPTVPNQENIGGNSKVAILS